MNWNTSGQLRSAALDHMIRLISFGYLHLSTGSDGPRSHPPPTASEDVRGWLRDPVGARELLTSFADYVDLPAGAHRIAIGCAGGRHRVGGRDTSAESALAPIESHNSSEESRKK